MPRPIAMSIARTQRRMYGGFPGGASSSHSIQESGGICKMCTYILKSIYYD